MTTNLIVQLSVISTDQLSSTSETCEASLETVYLTQHYRANPEAMNIIPIPICADSAPMLPLPTVDIKRHYKVLANHHIFFARKKAQCPFVLCLCLNHPEQKSNLWQAELQFKEQQAKFDIATMDAADLAQVFGYLSQKEKKLTALLEQKELVQAVAEHPGRPYWSSWDPIKALSKSCKASMAITKKHTDCLENYFFFAPKDLPNLCINIVSEEELREHFQILPLKKEIVDQLSHWLPGSPSRRYWRDSNDIVKIAKALDIVIPKAQQNILPKVFHFSPEPPPIPNNVAFLLEEMTVPKLRHEAKERGLAFRKDMKKKDLVRLLSSN